MRRADIREQITPSARRRLARLLGAEEWRIPHKPATSAQKGPHPRVASAQAWAVAAKPATCGTCVFYDQNDCCTCEASLYKGQKMWSWTTCEFAKAGVQASRPRFALQTCPSARGCDAAGFCRVALNIGERADGYATG
jgi:hypothetical protein